MIFTPGKLYRNQRTLRVWTYPPYEVKFYPQWSIFLFIEEKQNGGYCFLDFEGSKKELFLDHIASLKEVKIP